MSEPAIDPSTSEHEMKVPALAMGFFILGGLGILGVVAYCLFAFDQFSGPLGTSILLRSLAIIGFSLLSIALAQILTYLYNIALNTMPKSPGKTDS